MRRALNIQSDLTQLKTVEDLTEVFEGVASMHIARIRNHVVASKLFFAELWPTYRSLRISPGERLESRRHITKGKNVFVIVTSEGKLGSAVDEQIVNQMLSEMPSDNPPDIIAIGHHGLNHLQERHMEVVQSFTVPASDIDFSINDVMNALQQYDQISVFYQTYESLRAQKVERIELLNAVRELGQGVTADSGEVISSRDYIFEPNVSEIVEYMESVMMDIALTQIIMESKLAGYAARFNAMSRAKQKARDLVADTRLDYYRAKRTESDQRLQEIMKVVNHGRN